MQRVLLACQLLLDSGHDTRHGSKLKCLNQVRLTWPGMCGEACWPASFALAVAMTYVSAASLKMSRSDQPHLARHVRGVLLACQLRLGSGHDIRLSSKLEDVQIRSASPGQACAEGPCGLQASPWLWQSPAPAAAGHAHEIRLRPAACLSQQFRWFGEFVGLAMSLNQAATFCDISR